MKHFAFCMSLIFPVCLIAQSRINQLSVSNFEITSTTDTILSLKEYDNGIRALLIMLTVKINSQQKYQ